MFLTSINGDFSFFIFFFGEDRDFGNALLVGDGIHNDDFGKF